ncbi:MAG: hypothetical protein RLZZ528_623 [Pseudomonadota bacterium]
MPTQSFHSALGRSDFLGLRMRSGVTEIVYDDGRARRMIWRVATTVNDSVLGDVLRFAVGQRRVVPALQSELNRRRIDVEDVIGDPALM